MFCIRIIKYSNILNQNKLTRIYWNKLIENIVNQMSSNPPAPGVDHNMDDGLDRQKSKAEEETRAYEDRKQFKKDQNEETVRTHLSSSVSQTEAHAAADANADTYTDNLK